MQDTPVARVTRLVGSIYEARSALFDVFIEAVDEEASDEGLPELDLEDASDRMRDAMREAVGEALAVLENTDGAHVEQQFQVGVSSVVQTWAALQKPAH